MVPGHVDRCVVCGKDVGYPNVRAAERAEEQLALNKRYTDARSEASAAGCARAAADLDQRLRKSEAVICRSWGVAKQLLESDTVLYATFYHHLRAHVRLPEDNEYDRWRRVVDHTFFPHYFEEIRFAALSTSDSGATAFGECAVFLKNASIEDRASVFEENTYFFWKQRLHLAEEPPVGYRATWRERAKLGVAKLASLLKPSMNSDDLDRLVMTSGGRRAPDQFIEVHIYGPIHRASVSRIRGRAPRRKADQVMVADLKKKLHRINIDLTVK